MSKKKKIQILDFEELNKLHTGTLMARRRALLQCEESLSASDRLPGHQVEQGTIEFRQTKEWINAYQDLKKVLKNREHWGKRK